MTTPTSKPVPSNAPQDLLFNAETFDTLINESGRTTNRVGKSIPTYITAIQELGFDAPIVFASGINVDSSRVTVEYSGARYFAKPSEVPFVTTATFNPSQWSMFDESFAGAEMGRIANYSLLRAYAGAADVVMITDSGIAGQFNKTNRVGAVDNGGTVIVTSAGDVWEREFYGAVLIEWFGAKADGVFDNLPPVLAADAVGGELEFNSGVYFITGDVTFQSKVTIKKGAILKTTTGKFVFAGGFIAGLYKCLDSPIYNQFLDIERVLPQWFGARGDASYARGSINAGSNTFNVTSPAGLTGGFNGIKNGDTVFISGAGLGGGILSTTVLSGGTTATLTLATAAITTVTGRAIATRNDTLALQQFFNSVISGANTGGEGTNSPSTTGCTKLYMPHGSYCAFSELKHYSGNVLEGEFANTIGGARLIQCNYTQPLLRVLADNFNAAGGSINGGNGNNIFRNMVFGGAEFRDSALNANMIHFNFPWNGTNDTEFDHCLWQNTAGASVGGGYVTTGSITAGSTTLTLADGSQFRSGNIGGGKITIQGAGVAGADLDTYIVSGGGTNTVTIAADASTTISNQPVLPLVENISIKVNDCEMDVVRSGFNFIGAVTGSLVVNNLLAYSAVRSVLDLDSTKTYEVKISDSYIDGAGNPNDANSNYRNSIKINSPNTVDLFMDNVTITKSSGFGGRIQFTGNTISITDSYLLDLDSASPAKFITSNAITTKIKDNVIVSKSLTSYTNARLVSLTLSTSSDNAVTNNTFINTSASQVEAFISSDFPISSGQFANNKFRGPSISPMNANITNLPNNINGNVGYDGIQTSGTAIPTSGTWRAKDIVWNRSPTAGGFVGWVCVADGSPGTWKTFGAISA